MQMPFQNRSIEKRRIQAYISIIIYGLQAFCCKIVEESTAPSPRKVPPSGNSLPFLKVAYAQWADINEESRETRLLGGFPKPGNFRGHGVRDSQLHTQDFLEHSVLPRIPAQRCLVRIHWEPSSAACGYNAIQSMQDLQDSVTESQRKVRAGIAGFLIWCAQCCGFGENGSGKRNFLLARSSIDSNMDWRPEGKVAGGNSNRRGRLIRRNETTRVVE